MLQKLKAMFGSAAHWTAAFTGVLCLFTALLAYVSFEANRLNAANQRAIVNFNGPMFGKKMMPDGKKVKSYLVYYGWSNSGRSPAKNAFTQFNDSVGDRRPTKDTDFSSLSQRDTLPLILGPGTMFQVPPVELTVSQLDDVTSGKQHLFFWGWVTYDDGIPGSPRRLTEFCTDVTSVDWSGGPSMAHDDPANTMTINTPPCDKHNCYDDTCNDYSERTKSE